MINLQWFAGHRDILGNCEADELLIYASCYLWIFYQQSCYNIAESRWRQFFTAQKADKRVMNGIWVGSKEMKDYRTSSVRRQYFV